ncbi:hypothetical protein NHQ30_011516 [Ciborinia camelliae]|nr:hypothetical protein NHQ30_011516 [Ciborinia camelliae]
MAIERYYILVVIAVTVLKEYVLVICPSIVAPVCKVIRITRYLFNRPLLKPKEYRQGASREVYETWNNLGIDYPEVPVSAAFGARSGIEADQVKINEKHEGDYPANVEDLHHLRCLNLL